MNIKAVKTTVFWYSPHPQCVENSRFGAPISRLGPALTGRFASSVAVALAFALAPTVVVVIASIDRRNAEFCIVSV